MQISAGDIIKIKHNGAKAKFRVLGEEETIIKNCYYQRNDINRFDYDYSVECFRKKKSIYLSYAVGEPVAIHTNRVYLEKLTNI
jgi:hypothetical protein